MIIILTLPLIVLLNVRFFFFKEKFSPTRLIGDFISSLYFLSLFLGIVYFFLYPEDSRYDPNLSSMMFLSVCLVLYFAPLYYFQRRNQLALNIVNTFLFKSLCVVMLLGGFFSIAKFFLPAIEVLSGDPGKFRIALNAGNADVGSKGILDTIAVGYSTFFGIAQLLGFIVFSGTFFGRYSRVVGFFLLLSSFSYVLNVLTYVGRDGVVYWIMSFLFNMYMVKTLLGSDYVSRLNSFFKLVILIFSIPFFIISVSRFSIDVAYYIFSYLSQQLVTFNDVFVLNPPLYYGDLNFSEIKGIFFGMESQMSRDALFDYYLSNGVIPWNFKFFIGSFLADFGKIGTFFIMLFMSLTLFITMVKKKASSLNNKIISVDVLFLLYFYGQIGFMGVFYFKHSALNNYMLAFVGIILIFFFFRIIGFRSIIFLKNSQ